MWKIRYNKDSGLVSSFEQIEGIPLAITSEAQNNSGDEIEVEFTGEIPEDREGYKRTLYYGIEPKVGELKTASVYATYTLEGWFEVASKLEMSAKVGGSIINIVHAPISNVPPFDFPNGTSHYIVTSFDKPLELDQEVQIYVDYRGTKNNLVYDTYLQIGEWKAGTGNLTLPVNVGYYQCSAFSPQYKKFKVVANMVGKKDLRIKIDVKYIDKDLPSGGSFSVAVEVDRLTNSTAKNLLLISRGVGDDLTGVYSNLPLSPEEKTNIPYAANAKYLEPYKTANIYDYKSNVYSGALLESMAISSSGQHASVKVQCGQTYVVWHDKDSLWNNEYVNTCGYFETDSQQWKDVALSTFKFTDADFDTKHIGRIFTVPTSFTKPSGGVITDYVYFVINVNYEPTLKDANAIKTLTIEEGNLSSGYLPYNALFGYALAFSSQDSASSGRYVSQVIMTAGDSLTYGAGATDGYTYQAEMQRILQTRSIINKGNSGADSGRLVAILTEIKDRDTAVIPTTPSYDGIAAVTIMIGINGGPGGDVSKIPTISIYESLAAIEAGNPLVYEGITINTYLDYFNLFPDEYATNVALCIEWIRWKNPEIDVYLITTPQSSGRPTYPIPLREITISLGLYYSIEVLDAYAECGVTSKQEPILYADNIHLNNAGYKKLGAFLGNKMK